LLGNTSDGFIVNSLTGELISPPLDREHQDVYHLTVAAVNVAQPRLSSLITVTVNVLDENDHRPQFTVQYLLTSLSITLHCYLSSIPQRVGG